MTGHLKERYSSSKWLINDRRLDQLGSAGTRPGALVDLDGRLELYVFPDLSQTFASTHDRQEAPSPMHERSIEQIHEVINNLAHAVVAHQVA